MRKLHVRMLNGNFTNDLKRCILSSGNENEVYHSYLGGVVMIGWTIIAAAAVYGMVTVYQSEK